MTVIECSRLQGFPDTHCFIDRKPRRIDAEDARYYMSHGMECWQADDKWFTRVPADGPMYKALGNAMCVNVVRWIGRQIIAQLRAERNAS